jgi:hypothetical protein
MHTWLLAAALTLSPARAADDFGSLFGINPGDAMALAQKQQADAEAERAKQRSWDVFWGKVVEPRYPQKCTLEAVAKKLQVPLPADAEIPPVYFESWDQVYLYNFPEAYRYETGQKADRWFNIYMTKMNAIYMTDRRSAYLNGRTIDDSLALLYALYFQYRHTFNRDRAAFEAQAEDAQTRAVEVQRWYRAEFRRKSPCDAR